MILQTIIDNNVVVIKSKEDHRPFLFSSFVLFFCDCILFFFWGMYFVYVGSGGVMTAGTDWMSYGSELEEGLLDDDRGLDGDCFVFVPCL